MEDPPMSWQVGSTLTFEVEDLAAIALQVGVAAAPGRTVDDRLDVTLDGAPLARPVRQIRSRHGGRISRFDAPPGLLRITYQAVATGGAPDGEVGEGDGDEDLAQLEALRPSRYCPSDALLGFASGELDHGQAGADLARSVVGWVASRTVYILGSSGPLDTAVETLLTGQGVCRDFAHLGIGLARAVGLPARLVAAYAPGLDPMDFHAVPEVHVDGAWHVFDPTGLAPRASLLRIATGRDAADTAFAEVLSGTATLTGIEVRAVVDGVLPTDDGTALVRLP